VAVHFARGATYAETVAAAATLGPEWKTIALRRRLARAASAAQFAKAAETILTLRYFPLEVMTVSRPTEVDVGAEATMRLRTPSPSSPESAAVIEGEVFVQGVPLLPWLGLNHWVSLDLLTVDRVTEVMVTERVVTLAVGTTDEHEEIGLHKVWLRHDIETDDLWLDVCAASRFKPWVPLPSRIYARALQYRAHRIAAESLVKTVRAQGAPPVKKRLTAATTAAATTATTVGWSQSARSLDGAVVLVTGAAGFVGSRLVSQLVAAGAQVVGVDLRTMSEAHIDLSCIDTDRVQWVTGDVADAALLAHAMTLLPQKQPESAVDGGAKKEGKRRSFVVHLAAY
jgi:hypothetical protein